jgi:hypothetical protein
MHGVEYTILENLILRLYYGQPSIMPRSVAAEMRRIRSAFAFLPLVTASYVRA